ncbi:MAG TPA: phosphotransferase [Thermoanaerobaculia bacterium]
MTLAKVDRFVLPADDPGIASYLFERLLAPHNLRERLRRSALVSVPVLAPHLPLQSLNGQEPALEMVTAILGELLSGTLLEGRSARWLLVEDYAGNGRERLVLFLFATGETSPAAVVKLRRSGVAGNPLHCEAEALRFLAERLPADLRSSVPGVIVWREISGIEALMMSALPGVSAYVEMQGLLAPGRAVRRHFAAAAEWLARFHAATSASHGDFWARNLLVGPDGRAAVVDWEHFREDAPPHEDLFHFPLTYGLNYPWERWRRLPPDEAFRCTFLEDNRVSRAVASYLSRYAAVAGVDPDDLRRLFDVYLETRPESGLPWAEFRSLLGRAGRSVFSG